MKTEFKSAYVGYSKHSYLVTWKGKNDEFRIETLSADEARTRCADLQRKFKATCHMIDCSTGRKIKKLA